MVMNNKKAKRIIDLFERHELSTRAVVACDNIRFDNDNLQEYCFTSFSFFKCFSFQDYIPVILLLDKENEDGYLEWHIVWYDFSNTVIDAVFEYSDEFVECVNRFGIGAMTDSINELID